MLKIKRTKVEAIIGEAEQEQGRQQSQERTTGMFAQVILSGWHGGVSPHNRCDKSANGLLENAGRELAAQLEIGWTARVPETQYELEDRTVLLAQSDPDDRALAMHALEKAGIKHRVVLARDGVEALNYLFGTGHYEGRDTSSMPELVLLDLRMPRLDGTDVVRHMRSNHRTKSLPVFILVSSTEVQDALNASGPKPSGYVLKPVNFVELPDGVRQLKVRVGVPH